MTESLTPGCGLSLVLVFAFVFGQFERGAAQATHDRAVLDLLGRELDAPGLGQAGALGGYPPSAALGWLAWPVTALAALSAAASSGPGCAGLVDQEREPGRVDRGDDVGVGSRRRPAR